MRHAPSILTILFFGAELEDHNKSRWWFQMFFIFTPTWGNDPMWLIFFHMGWNHHLLNPMNMLHKSPQRGTIWWYSSQQWHSYGEWLRSNCWSSTEMFNRFQVRGPRKFAAWNSRTPILKTRSCVTLDVEVWNKRWWYKICWFYHVLQGYNISFYDYIQQDCTAFSDDIHRSHRSCCCMPAGLWLLMDQVRTKKTNRNSWKLSILSCVM